MAPSIQTSLKNLPLICNTDHDTIVSVDMTSSRKVSLSLEKKTYTKKVTKIRNNFREFANCDIDTMWSVFTVVIRKSIGKGKPVKMAQVEHPNLQNNNKIRKNRNNKLIKCKEKILQGQF